MSTINSACFHLTCSECKSPKSPSANRDASRTAHLCAHIILTEPNRVQRSSERSVRVSDRDELSNSTNYRVQIQPRRPASKQRHVIHRHAHMRRAVVLRRRAQRCCQRFREGLKDYKPHSPADVSAPNGPMGQHHGE